MKPKIVHVNFKKEKRSRKLKKFYDETKEISPIVLSIMTLSAYVTTLIYLLFQKEKKNE